MKEIFLYGEIGHEVQADAVVQQFQDSSGEDILLRVHSGGGSVFDGLAIQTAIRQHGGPVTAQIDGVAFSMAANLALECDKIHMAEDGWMMFHEAHTGVRGGAEDLQRSLKILNEVNWTTANRLAKRMDADHDTVAAALREEIWETGTGWKDLGVVEELLPAAKVAANHPINIDIDAFQKIGLDSSMKDAVKNLLEKLGHAEEPPAVPDNVIEIEDLRNEVEAYKLALENLSGQLKDSQAREVEARKSAGAVAARALAAAGHDRVDVGATEKDQGLEAQYKDISARVKNGEPGAAQERIKFRKQHSAAIKNLNA